MGTKENPNPNDCYERALPDEPMFVLLARDPLFEEFVEQWAHRRSYAIQCGERPASDQAVVDEALRCAAEGARWRRQNNGRWRK